MGTGSASPGAPAAAGTHAMLAGCCQKQAKSVTSVTDSDSDQHEAAEGTDFGQEPEAHRA